jgi:diphthine synthase
MLCFIGLGLKPSDLSLEALERLEECKRIFAEVYTSPYDLESLEKLIGRKIEVLSREEVESGKRILETAKEEKIAFLIPGDCFSATTHISLLLAALKQEIGVQVTHGVSIFSAVGEIGISLYKFGKTCSIPKPEPGFRPESFYDVIRENQKIGAHTLVLTCLDSRKAIQLLLEIEERRKEGVFGREKLCIGIARLGSEDQLVKFGRAKELLGIDFGKPPHCLIIPSKLNFVEREALERFKVGKER